MSRGRCCVWVLPTQCLLLLFLVLAPGCVALTTSSQRQQARARTHRMRRKHVEVSSVYVGRAPLVLEQSASRHRRSAATSLVQEEDEDSMFPRRFRDFVVTMPAQAPQAGTCKVITTGKYDDVCPQITNPEECNSHREAEGQQHCEWQAGAPAAAAAAPGPAPAASPSASPGPAPAGVASATLSAPAIRGDASIEVPNQDDFKVGDTIRIGEESSLVFETKKIIAFGSLILDSPLQSSYPASTVVIVVPESEAGSSIPPAPQQSLDLEVLNPMVSQSADGAAEAKTLSEMNDMLDSERQAMDPNDPLSQYKEELAAVEWLEDRLEEKSDDLKEENYRAKIAVAQAALAKETSPGTARMLGDMRREMHTLAAPFFSKVLNRQLRSLQRQKKALLAKIEGGDSQEAPEKKEKAEEIDVEDEPMLEAPTLPDVPSEDIFEAHYKLIMYTCAVLALLIGGACGLISRQRQRFQV